MRPFCQGIFKKNRRKMSSGVLQGRIWMSDRYFDEKGDIMKKYTIPNIYQKMNERGYTNAQSDLYLWLNEMEWMTIDIIKEYEYDEGETKNIVTFAITGAGDKWVWLVENSEEEYAVGLCERAETTGIYYAKNTEDAILRQIIEYAASSNFYIIEDDAEDYQINEDELKKQLEEWQKKFSGIINDEYINIIKKLSELSLKQIKCQYGEWYALLTLEEQDELIDKYIKFDLIDEEFEIYND